MRNALTTRRSARFLWLACWLLLSAVRPAGAQAPAAPATQAGACSTEVYLYVEKSASASTRDTTRHVLELFSPASGLQSQQIQLLGQTTVRLFSFAGEISTSTLAQFTVPGSPANVIDSALQGAVLTAPSGATTDLLVAFRHIQQTIQPAAPPPLGPARRFIFVLADFAHAPLSQAWISQGPALLDQLRRTAVANQNVHLIAIQSPPPGPLPQGPHREVTSAIARSFLFFEDSTAGLQEIGNLLNDTSTPLGMNLSSSATPGNLSLQISNPTCSRQEQIVYRARGDGVAPHVLTLTCPSALDSGVGGGPCPIDATLLRTLAPTNGCGNLWIEAETAVPDARGVIRRGTAPQPILLGNCMEITEGAHDLRRKFLRAPELTDYPRPPAPPKNDESFGTGLRIRGHIDTPNVNITWTEIPPSGGTPVSLGTKQVPSTQINGNAFDGALRRFSESIGLPKDVARRICLEGRSDEPTRLRVGVDWGTGQATADLIRAYPAKSGIFSQNPWEINLLTLLLCVLGIFAANHLMPAEIGKLSKVMVALATGFLVLGLSAHYASELGDLFEESFAVRLEEISTIGVVAIGLCYLVLLLMGYFDQRPTAKECLDHVREQSFKARKSRRLRHTVIGLSLILVPILLTIGAIWLRPRNLEECRFTYTSVQAP
jgi:hypothetical protein